MIFPWNDFSETDLENIEPISENLDMGVLGFKLSEALDGVAKIVSIFDFSSIDSYKTINQKQRDLIAQNPKLAIRNMSDGYELETERLLAIQQKSSKGFTVYNINPGLLSENDYPLSLNYEFIYDGVNYSPDLDGSIGKNFRTINIDQQGTFLMVEFVTENNNILNSSQSPIYIANLPVRPHSKRKYEQLLGREDIYYATNPMRLDAASKNIVFVNFGTTNTRPLTITKSGQVIKTYFSDLTITIPVGGPKIRITIGFNSEIVSTSTGDAINAQIETSGMSRVLGDIENPMLPFCLRQTDVAMVPMPTLLGGLNVPYATTESQLSWIIVYNSMNALPLIGEPSYEQLGYGLLYITDIFLSFGLFATIARLDVSIEFFIRGINVGSTFFKRVYSFDTTLAFNASAPEQSSQRISFSKPLRVVIPSGCALAIGITVKSGVGTGSMAFKYTVTGYAVGELLRKFINEQGMNSVFLSKVLTDSVLINQLNNGPYTI